MKSRHYGYILALVGMFGSTLVSSIFSLDPVSIVIGMVFGAMCIAGGYMIGS